MNNILTKVEELTKQNKELRKRRYEDNMLLKFNNNIIRKNYTIHFDKILEMDFHLEFSDEIKCEVIKNHAIKEFKLSKDIVCEEHKEVFELGYGHYPYVGDCLYTLRIRLYDYNELSLWEKILLRRYT